MVNFVRKRLQVFVSSTFTDLIKERQAAVEAILTAGHIPAGMELFTSGDESQMDVIKQWIDESDVYMMILAGRYGSIEPNTKKSYTHLEYEYAIEKDKPLFSCVITDNALDKRVKEHGSSQIETDKPQEFKEFHKLACSKIVKYWEDHKDIKIAISETLANFSRHEDLVGWVRPNKEEADMPALADEITRLSKENALLRRQVENDPQEKYIEGFNNHNELKAALTLDNLLSFFVKNSGQLAQGFQIIDPNNQHIPKYNKLCVYGMVEFKTNGAYALTDAGKVLEASQ